jgi:hypothetical protein
MERTCPEGEGKEPGPAGGGEIASYEQETPIPPSADQAGNTGEIWRG